MSDVAIWSVCVTGAVALGVPLVAERAARRRQHAERTTQLELAKLDDLRQMLDAGFDIGQAALEAARETFDSAEQVLRTVHDANSLHRAARAAQAKAKAGEQDLDQPSSSVRSLVTTAEHLSERLDTALHLADGAVESLTTAGDALARSLEGLPLTIRRLVVRLSADDPGVVAYRDVLTHLRAITAAVGTLLNKAKDSARADDQQGVAEDLLRRLRQDLESSGDGLARYAARAQQLVGVQRDR